MMPTRVAISLKPSMDVACANLNDKTAFSLIRDRKKHLPCFGTK